MHHLLAGFKSLFTDTLMATIDKCRLLCGGAGYQSGSGFSELWSISSPAQTFEGDNVVMMLQASRFQFKLFKKVTEQKLAVQYPFEYFNQIDFLLSLKG